MAEKSGKKKTKKAAKASADPSVLGNLRTTRPTRLGGDRRTTTPRAAAAAKTSAATKPASATRSSGAAKSTRATASPASAKSSAAKPKTAKPKAAAPKAAAPKAATPPAGWQTPDQDGRRGGPPSGTEIVTTAVQAAGELAQIGIAVGGRMLKRAAGRIPRP